MTPQLRHLVRLMLAVTMVFSPVALAGTQIDQVTSAATRLTQWFAEFLKPFTEIGEQAEKQYFIDRLIDLNRDLFDVEQDKRHIILALKRRPLNWDELGRTSNDLETKIRQLQSSIRKLGPLLRLKYRQGGNEAVELLSTAGVVRKGWLDNLRANRWREESATLEITKDAESAVEALNAAQVSLVKIIDHLQHN